MRVNRDELESAIYTLLMSTSFKDLTPKLLEWIRIYGERLSFRGNDFRLDIGTKMIDREHFVVFKIDSDEFRYDVVVCFNPNTREKILYLGGIRHDIGSNDTIGDHLFSTITKSYI